MLIEAGFAGFDGAARRDLNKAVAICVFPHRIYLFSVASRSPPAIHEPRMDLQKLNATDWACCGGVLAGLALIIWANVRLKAGGPKLMISASPGKGWAQFQVTLTNTGNLPTAIKSVRLRCHARGTLGIWPEVDLRDWFGLFGCELSEPLFALQPGESREIEIGPNGGRPAFPDRSLVLTVEVRAAHRFRPFRIAPDPTNFNKYAQAMAIKTIITEHDGS